MTSEQYPESSKPLIYLGYSIMRQKELLAAEKHFREATDRLHEEHGIRVDHITGKVLEEEK